MADINVNVVLPDPISVDVTSPTQALATNISVPGPQGPTGPKGNPTTINSLGAENIIITGANGNIVSNDGISTIYISGNSGYFQSAVNSLTTNLTLTGANLNTSIISLSGLFTEYTGSLDNNYATDAQLQNTGSNLYTLLTNFSGNLDANYATDTQLFNTGSTLDSKINSLSGYSASAINLASTGSNLYTLITNFSGNLDADFASQAELNSLSGYVNSQDTSISNNLTSTGSTLDNKINSLSGSSASAVNLTSTGATLITNLFNTGSDLNTKIDNLSGYVNAQDNNISTNLYNTGSTLDTKINNLSGYVNTQDNSISNNLNTTGSTLDTKINSLSGSAVLLYGNQSIGGVKTFRDNVYINNLFVTGTETIVSTNNFSVQSPYLLLNLTGGAVDGGIFFVTGVGLTGINDTGPIIGFDHSNKFKFGISTRNSDHSTLPDIASVQQIEAYSGVANNTFSTITNLALTGSTLNNKINSLSGWSASAANLFTTGSTLDIKINSLSGWSASAINLASTGSTLDSKINSLSGWSASAANLASTGSTLDSKINNLSGVSVLTFGDQNISGIKTFNSGLATRYISGVSGSSLDIIGYSGEVVSAANRSINIRAGHGPTTIPLFGGSVNINAGNSPNFNTAGNINLTAGTGTNNNAGGVNIYAGVSPNYAGTNTIFGNININGSGPSTTTPKTINIYRSGNVGAFPFAFVGVVIDNDKVDVNNGMVLQVSGVNVTPSLYATSANLDSTGFTLNTKINNLSGYINSTSSNIVFTTGNQTISGVKTFIQDTTFGDSAQGDFLVISGNNFTVYGSGNFTSGLFVNSSPVLTGSSTLYATTVNLASTGSTLDNKINNLSGVSVLRFGDQTISGVKTFATGVNISGNVGIGTITPFAKLHIAGAPALLNTTMEDILYLQRPFNAGVAFGSRAVLRLGKYTSESSQSFTRLDIALRSGSDNTAIDTPPEINVMTLRADGNVGIGTTTPSEKLTVVGNASVSGNLTVSGNINISGNYDVYSQIENTKKLAIAYAIAL